MGRVLATEPGPRQSTRSKAPRPERNITAQAVTRAPRRAPRARSSRADVEALPLEGGHEADVEAIVWMTTSWWAERAQAAGLSGSWLHPHLAISGLQPLEEVADAPVEAAGKDRADAAASTETLGAAYLEALRPGVRNAHGRHYTPASLAEHLWGQTRAALRWPRRAERLQGLVVDPACGAGALLLPPLREHLAASRDVQPEIVLRAIPSLVEGTDLDPVAVWIANVVLAAELLPLIARIDSRRRPPVPTLCRVDDGLATQQTR